MAVGQQVLVRKPQGAGAGGLLRAQVKELHRQLDEGLAEFVGGLDAAAPPTESLVVELFVHAVTVEDVTVQSLLRRVAPVYETDWDGGGPARYSMTDLAPVRAYARQVFGLTDAYLAGLSPEELIRGVDLTRIGQGRPTVALVVSKFVVLQLSKIYGELASAARSQRRPGPRSGQAVPPR